RSVGCCFRWESSSTPIRLSQRLSHSMASVLQRRCLRGKSKTQVRLAVQITVRLILPKEHRCSHFWLHARKEPKCAMSQSFRSPCDGTRHLWRVSAKTRPVLRLNAYEA